jgi:hypothetical protein
MTKRCRNSQEKVEDVNHLTHVWNGHLISIKMFHCFTSNLPYIYDYKHSMACLYIIVPPLDSGYISLWSHRQRPLPKYSGLIRPLANFSCYSKPNSYFLLHGLPHPKNFCNINNGLRMLPMKYSSLVIKLPWTYYISSRSFHQGLFLILLYIWQPR